MKELMALAGREEFTLSKIARKPLARLATAPGRQLWTTRLFQFYPTKNLGATRCGMV